MIPIGRGCFISQNADAKGNYHLFYPEAPDSYSQVTIKVDPKLAQKLGSSVETLAQLVGAALDSGDLKKDGELKMEYLPATPLQTEGIRVQTATSTLWTQVEDAGVKDQYWSAIERFIQEDQYGESTATGLGLYKVEAQKPFPPEAILRSVYYSHEVEGRCYGSEAAEQTPMVSQFIHSSEALCYSLEEEIEGLKEAIAANEGLLTSMTSSMTAERDGALAEIRAWRKRLELANLQLDFQKERLAQARAYFARTGTEMVDSNYFRDLLKEVRAEYLEEKKCKKSQLIQQDFDEIYKRACDRFVPALCNCWQQEARGQYFDSQVGASISDTDSWMRLGAFYDTRSGLCSSLDFFDPTTGDLKDDTDLQKLGDALIGQLNQQVQEFTAKLPENLNFFQKMTSKLSRGSLLGCIASVKWLVERLDPAGSGRVDLPSLKKLLMERKAIQEASFLSLLEKQVVRLKPGDNTLKWLHVSLLKPFESWKVADQKDYPGWTHNEHNEIKEMAWVFRHFRGAEISFDTKEGPTKIEYDQHGKPSRIVLGAQHAPEGFTGRSAHLESHFVSCSVAAGVFTTQGHKTEEGRQMQADLNHDFYAYARSDSTLDSTKTVDTRRGAAAEPEIVDALEQGYSSFEAASQISQFLLRKGWAISGGCQSGKDRTGFWASRIAQHKVLSTFDEHPPANVSSTTRRLLDENPLRGHRVTKQILAANTGKTAIKVGVFSLPGYDGFFRPRRLSHYARLVYEQVLQKKSAKTQAVVEKKFTI